ncbi:putative transposon gamma-delta 80.3 kDa protein [Cupriavidus neocaledonicus]|uniref:Putative transposon gamma-delta 80.3 kDa protein n=2 Tax=Cupriavidus neocaledonicus TaxID=1040979 RepID=A0A375HDJ3_9BURK|nr:putative transposon gamma-delta 80.3 kDa protein [Cupriavidus neocaledonicus]
MFAKLVDFWGSQKAAHVIPIAPEDYQTINFRAVFKAFDGRYSYIRSVSKMIWKYGLLLEMLHHLSKHFKTRERMADFGIANDHIKRWQSISKDFFTKVSSIALPLIRKDGDMEMVIGQLHQSLEIPEIEDAFAKLMKSSAVRFFILVDRLDEGYENDEGGAAIVSGAIAVGADLNKRYEHVRVVIFQRDNILRAVQKFDPDYTRNIEGEVIPIHWDTYQLQNLVSKRLNAAFALDIENTQKIWDRCTANEASGRELQGIDGFKKCLQFTLYRPRDLLSLLNQAFYSAGREDRNTIILRDIEKTAKTISGNRLDDLKKEYSSIIPSLPSAVSMFENGNPEMNYPDAAALLSEMPLVLKSSNAGAAAEQDFAILKSDGTIRSLYSVGFIGTHDENSNTFTFCHDGRQPDRDFTAQDRILVHPCYWIALNLSRNALAPDEAEQINDEYEIKVTSVSPQIRAQRIGSLMAELGHIDEGREHADSFEEWTLTAIQTVFAGHLANVERKVNGNATQRRDIVGTNLAKSSAWERIQKDYGVRQVVFDAKNYQSVGRDEYRQMSTYLHGPYGRLGFLVTRDEDESLRAGAELDWVRELFTTEKKLIIRLSYKFFQRILGKLRNPEKHDAVDGALSTLLDNYERRYLSLQTTRATRTKR